MAKLLSVRSQELPCESECTRIPWSLVKQTGRKISVSRLKCKQWDCPVCGPRRQKQLKHTGRVGNPNKFITLTASPQSGSTPHEQAQNLRTAWRAVRRKASKIWNHGKIEFLAVFETTEAGAPHLHILARTRYIDQRWLSKEMARHTSSPIVDIRKVRSKRHAAWYISKYVSKAPERFNGCKRYWKTMEWCAPKERQQLIPGVHPDIYYLARALPAKVLKTFIKQGFTSDPSGRPTDITWEHDIPPPVRPGHFYGVTWNPAIAQYTY